MKYIIATMLAMLMSFAYANPPEDVDPPGLNKQGGNAEQQQQQAQGQQQGQAQAAVAVSEGSNANSSTNITTGGVVLNSSQSNNYEKDAAHSAAGVFPTACQEGASGQSYSGGASSVFESAMCQSLKMAEVHQNYWKMYSEMGDTNQAEMHKKLMDEYIVQAGDSADLLYYPKQIGSFFLSILPIGLLFLL